METESKKTSVKDIWNALKEDEATRNTRNSASRTKVDWNSYHIRDAIKPKKKFFPAVRCCDSHLADYSLMEAAHLFRNSEGSLEVGCPYECRDTCRSFKRGENNENGDKDTLPGGVDRQPDLVVSQYARLKAAYQEKLRKEKLATLGTCLDQHKQDVVPGNATVPVAGLQNYPEDSSPSEEESLNKLRAEIGKLAATGEEPEDDSKDVDDDLDVETLRNRAHLAGAYLSDEAREGVAKRLEEGDMGCETAIDLGSKEKDPILDVKREQARKETSEGLVTKAELAEEENSDNPITDSQELAKQDSSEPAKVTESHHVRFTLPEEEFRSPASIDISNVEESPENQTLANALNKDLNCLTGEAIGVRLAALQRLQSTLFGEMSNGQSVEEKIRSKDETRRHSLGWAAEELVIKPLLRRFGDPSEKCRIFAVSILHKLLQEVPSAVIVLLPYILPVIGERMPLKVPLGATVTEEDELLKEPPVIQAILLEPSEEVRLHLVQFMRSLLKQAPRLIQAFASDVASILVAATFDTHPDVLLETFPALELLGEIMEYRLKPVGKQLVRACHRSLSHNHSRVRVAALKAICRLTMCGAHDAIYELTAYRDPNLIPIKAFYEPVPKTQYLAMLATDKNSVVREELYRTIGRWLRKLGERREHECRLLPYLLAGFQDSCPLLQTLAFELMEGVGLQYEEENVNEVKDTRTYLTEDIDDIVSVCGTPLPHPFQKRPCLGARIMVKSVAAILLHAISQDIECWTTGTKELAARFLLTLLLFVESNITMHLQPLLKIMHRAMGEPSITDKILESAKVLGFFVDTGSYLPLIMPLIHGDVSADVSVNTLGHALGLLAGTLTGSSPEQILPHIPEICSTLTDHHIMTSIQQTVNDGVVAVAEQLIRAWDAKACAKEVSAMLWLLLNAAAATDFCSRSPQKAESAMQSLALASGNESQEAIIALYVDEMLEILPHPRKWALRSLDALVFCRLLQSSALVDEEALDKLIKAFSNCIRKAADDDVKCRLIRAVEQLLTKGQYHWAHGKRHIGDMWESFLVPCLQQDDTLVPPTLDAVVSIWSKSIPKEIAKKHQFHDTEQALLRAIEKVVKKHTGQDAEEVASNEEGDQEKLQEEKKFQEFMKKMTAPPLDAPIEDPIRVKCMETLTFMVSRSAKRFDAGR